MGGQILPPSGSFLRMDAQHHPGRAVDLFESYSHDSGQQQGIELSFAVQNLAGNAERQLHHLSFHFLKVSGAIVGKLGQSSGQAGPLPRQLFFESLARLGLSLLPDERKLHQAHGSIGGVSIVGPAARSLGPARLSIIAARALAPAGMES